MRECQRKSGAAFWTTVLLLAPLLYLVSFGPAVWAASRGYLKTETIEAIYPTVIKLAVHGPRHVQKAIKCWGALGISGTDFVLFWIPTSDGEFMLLFGSPPPP